MNDKDIVLIEKILYETEDINEAIKEIKNKKQQCFTLFC